MECDVNAGIGRACFRSSNFCSYHCDAESKFLPRNFTTAGIDLLLKTLYDHQEETEMIILDFNFKINVEIIE